MILLNSYTAEWISSHKAKKGQEKINPPLAEKMIFALGLVEALADSKLKFVFKGGTSLILLLQSPGRFSIDIDIVTSENRDTIENILSTICNSKPFKNFVLNEQRSYQPGVPKAHYSLIYDSPLTNKENHILLDILFEEHSYPELLELPIKTDWLQTDDKNILVNIPTPESITGDKLTAFAPNTTGILYNNGKELEIVKQLYDLGKLFHEIKNVEIVAGAFYKTVAKEISYRGNKCKPEDVLQDVIDTGLLIAKREKHKEEPYLSNFKEIQHGLLQFKTYQISSFFRIEDAIISSAKAAYLAAMIKTNAKGSMEIFSGKEKKEEHLITNEKLNYLNKLSIEAIFYWKKTLNLLDLN